MELVTLGLGVAGVLSVPIGAGLNKSYGNEKRISTLEANDKNVTDRLDRIEAKLDRLVERFL